MKPLALILFASVLATAAQTPYDSFAPEQAEKAMIELDRSEYSLVNPDSSGTVRCIVISWVDGTYSAFDQAGIAAEGSIDPLDKKFHTMDPKMEEMPQVSPYVYCFANPIGYTDLSGLKPSMEEAARMADYVYGTNVKLIGGWIAVQESQFNIFSGNGLKTQLFQRSLKDGRIEYSLAFAGTEFDNLKDPLNDCFQIGGGSLLSILKLWI